MYIHSILGHQIKVDLSCGIPGSENICDQYVKITEWQNTGLFPQNNWSVQSGGELVAIMWADWLNERENMLTWAVWLGQMDPQALCHVWFDKILWTYRWNHLRLMQTKCIQTNQLPKAFKSQVEKFEHQLNILLSIYLFRYDKVVVALFFLKSPVFRDTY